MKWGNLILDAALVSELRARYGIEFQNLALLDEAFTHSSYVNEHRELGLRDNERLEFLGDAVMEITVSEYLYKKISGLARRQTDTLTGGNRLHEEFQ